MSRFKSVLRKLGISFASLAFFLVIAELVARAAEPGPFSFVDRNPYVDSQGADGHVRHRPNFVGRWDGTWYEIDTRGFRGSEVEPTFEPSELRIVCLGDSCTFGKGVNESDSWPRQLEARLADESGSAYDPVVFNLGINGGDGRIYREIFEERGKALKPQVVVVGYNLNDFPNSIQAVDEKVFEDRKLRRLIPTNLRDSFNRSALYRYARAVYYDMKRERDWKFAEATASQTASQPIDSEVWVKQRRFLEDIREMAREEGGSMVVFLFPYESQVYLDSYDRTPIERLGELCADLDVPFVDLATEFRTAARTSDPPHQLFLRGDRYHPNATGYGIVADRVASILRDEGWLPRQ